MVLPTGDIGTEKGERTPRDAYVRLQASFNDNQFGPLDYLCLSGITKYMLL